MREGSNVSSAMYARTASMAFLRPMLRSSWVVRAFALASTPSVRRSMITASV